MSRSYGISYQGSKNLILKKICGLFPSAENFYDLFGGGFSVTHFMAENRRKDFRGFHYNEIRSGLPQFIQSCINGEYEEENFSPKFLSRKDFFAQKNDWYVASTWSFGGNAKDYMYGKDIEDKKKSLHQAIVFNEFDEYARQALGIDQFKDHTKINQKLSFFRNRPKKTNLKQFKQIEHLENLNRLNGLTSLKGRSDIYFTNLDYRSVKIRPDSVVYCDIPYINTVGYSNAFDHPEFYQWAAELCHPVYVSEYQLDDPRFKCVLNISKKVLMSARGSTETKNEKIFANRAGMKKLFEYHKSRKGNGKTAQGN